MRRKQFRSEDLARQDKPRPCPECPKYSTCRKPCDEVERWVSQDHVGLNTRVVLLQDMDLPNSYNSFLDRAANNKENVDMVRPDPELAKESWEIVEALNIPEKAMEFAELYYRQGKTLAQTAKALGISSQAANDRHKKLKKEVRERLQRIEIWSEIKDEFSDLEDGDLGRNDIILMLFFGALKDRKKIAEIVGVTYAWVGEVIREFNRNILDK